MPRTKCNGVGVHATESPRRRTAMQLIGLGLIMPLTACSQGESEMQQGTVLALVMYSYLDRPIHEIVFNDTALGVANKYGGTGIITAVQIPYGVQTLRWNLGGPEGMPRNGELVSTKNTVIVSPEQVPSGTRYIGLHLYPDYTLEVAFAEFIPERTARGIKIIRASKL
jgi:hypothetical protein